MKKLLLTACCILFSLNLAAQIKDANFVVDYSKASICGMDENSFAVYEKDWLKDKPVITSKMLQEVLLRTGERLVFKKDSPNTVKITVLVITENGGYNCIVEFIDDKNTALFEPKPVTCYKGGTFGSKLNLMKDGAQKIGKTIGKTLKAALKKIAQ